MNIIIISHERSLNKAEGLLNVYKNDNVTLIVDSMPNLTLKSYVALSKNIIVSKGFNVVDITKKISNCDKVWCVSENLLPIQSQLESFYGIKNLTPFAAEILSNKQKFDDFCRNIGLGKFVPTSITPTFHNQLDIFKNHEIFTKPDIGSGSNVFFPNEIQNTPQVEYRRWNNKHHLLKFLTDKNVHELFFSLNKKGIHSERFNYKPCKIMVQEYHWSEEPSIAPIGVVRNKKLEILFYLKMSKVKYGDLLDPNSDPIESHSNSKSSDIAKDRAVWISSIDEVAPEKHKRITYFLERLIDELGIHNLIFAGPDFHISNDRLIAIDFNPRPGQFMNILDKVNNYSIFENMIKGVPIVIKNKLLWGCAVLTPGKIAKLGNLGAVEQYFNAQNTILKEGITIPDFQNIQNKSFNVNLDIIGSNEQELFDRYAEINQLLQSKITY